MRGYCKAHTHHTFVYANPHYSERKLVKKEETPDIHMENTDRNATSVTQASDRPRDPGGLSLQCYPLHQRELYWTKLLLKEAATAISQIIAKGDIMDLLSGASFLS